MLNDKNFINIAFELAKASKCVSKQVGAVIVKDKHIRRINNYKNEKLAESIKNSYIGRLGRLIAPVFRPLGFDWKITTAVISAIPAKEVFVSQLSIINAVAAGEEDNSLRNRLKKQYSPLVGFCIMLWMLIATPCIATVAIVIQETNSVKWAMVQFFGLSFIAYVLTFIVYQVGIFFV
jgi:ferrous iron transport protein B